MFKPINEKTEVNADAGLRNARYKDLRHKPEELCIQDVIPQPGGTFIADAIDELEKAHPEAKNDHGISASIVAKAMAVGLDRYRDAIIKGETEFELLEMSEVLGTIAAMPRSKWSELWAIPMLVHIASLSALFDRMRIDVVCQLAADVPDEVARKVANAFAEVKKRGDFPSLTPEALALLEELCVETAKAAVAVTFRDVTASLKSGETITSTTPKEE